MKKDVLIEVENTQTLGGRDEKYTVSVNGTLEYGDGRYTLAYTEYDGELKGCKTLVTVEGGDSVSGKRRHARNRVHNRICPRFKGSQLNENNCF